MSVQRAGIGAPMLILVALQAVGIPAGLCLADDFSGVEFPAATVSGFRHASGTDFEIRYTSSFAGYVPDRSLGGLVSDPPGAVEFPSYPGGFVAGDTVKVRLEAPEGRSFRADPHPDYGFADLYAGLTWNQPALLPGNFEVPDVSVSLIGLSGEIPEPVSNRASIRNLATIPPMAPSLLSVSGSFRIESVIEFEAIEIEFLSPVDGVGPWEPAYLWFRSGVEVPIGEPLADAVLLQLVPEPGAAVLLISGAACCGRTRRRAS